MFSVVLKDYLDHLHDLSLVVDYANFFELVKASLSYVIQSIGLGVYYVVSFHWLRDFMELPVVFKHNYNVILEGQTILRRSYESKFALSHGAFSFFDTSPLNRHSLFSGFLNSFFLCLPLSVPHFLSIRALLVNGSLAGFTSFLGTLCGQILFYICMLLGLEFIMQPFFQFDFLMILLGCVITVETLNKLVNRPDFTIFNVLDRKPLWNFFRINFILAWFEQVCVSNYFGNISVSSVMSIFETTNSPYYLFITLFYLVGLIIGCLFWSICFGILIVQLRTWITNRLVNTSFFEISQKIHYGCVTGLLVMAMSSFFYYGYDCFITRSLGYVSEDQAMQWVNPVYKNHHKISRTVEQEGILQGNPNLEHSLEDEDQCDVLIDAQPFHSSDERPELNFETFAVNSNVDFLNRDRVLDRAEERTGLFRPQSKIKRPYRDMASYYSKEEEEFMTPNIDIQEPDELFFDEDVGENIKLFEILLAGAFRTDTYGAQRDGVTDTYLPETQLIRQFREKYTTNPVYNVLLKLDNFSFLSGQPQKNRLAAKDEHSLYKRRFILQHYLNSVSKYKKIIARDNVAFPEKVYNQQFKGSLEFVRRFKAVRFTEYGTDVNNRWIKPPSNLNKKVLKYDQPLYKKHKREQIALLHEELPRKKRLFRPRRFLKLNDTRPLYIGWDNHLRKFMIKSVRVSSGLNDGQAMPCESKTTDVRLCSGLNDDGQVMPCASKTTELKKATDVSSERSGSESLESSEKAENSENAKKKGNKKSGKRQKQNHAKKQAKKGKNEPSQELEKGKKVIYTQYDHYPPVKKRPVPTKWELPDYYHFQAWSPGVEKTVDHTTKFKLPSLKATAEQLQAVGEALYVFDEDELNENMLEDPTERKEYKTTLINLALKKAIFKDLFNRLPLYDWYWAALDIDDERMEHMPTFRVGDATTPKLDGLAWPGQNERYEFTCPGFIKDELDLEALSR